MAYSVNKATILGNLGRDPEVRFTSSGKAVCELRIATSERWGGRENPQEQTEWHRVVVWEKQAELCGRFLTKGSKVYVEGRIQTREYNDKDGNRRFTTEIVAREIVFLDGRAGGEGAEAGSGSYAGGGARGSSPAGSEGAAGGVGGPADSGAGPSSGRGGGSGGGYSGGGSGGGYSGGGSGGGYSGGGSGGGYSGGGTRGGAAPGGVGRGAAGTDSGAQDDQVPYSDDEDIPF